STRLRGLCVRRCRPGARRRLRARAGRARRRRPARRAVLAVVGARRGLGRPPSYICGGGHPIEPVRLRARDGAALRARGARARADGIDPAYARLTRSADIRYKGQINEVEVPVPAGALDDNALAQLVSDFHRRYETVYGQGAGFREARVEVVTYRVRASAVSAKPRIVAAPEAARAPSREASARTRPVSRRP